MTNDKQRERLVELLEDVIGDGWRTMCEAIADNLIIEGGIIVPPCKVGKTIYMITRRMSRDRKYYRSILKTKLSYFNIERVMQDFGKTVFLTKEEAEKALGGVQG